MSDGRAATVPAHHGRRLVAAAAAALGSDLLLGQIERIVREEVVIWSDGGSLKSFAADL